MKPPIAAGPQPGDFGLVASKGWVGATIRRVTHSAVSHAFILEKRGTIIEAAGGGVRRSRADKYPDAVWSTGRVDSQGKGDAIAAAAVALIGKPYSFADLGALLLSAEGVIVLPVFKVLNRDGHVICSQVVSQAWTAAGIALCPNKWACRVTPEDLLAVIQHRPVPENR